MAKIYTVQKNCFIFTDFLLPQGYDAAVVSSEYELSNAVL